jgi:hypothetical protein
MKIRTDKVPWNCHGCDAVNMAAVGLQTDLGTVWLCADCLDTVAERSALWQTERAQGRKI